jgi:RNA polymerase sigma-70 factor (ECF subfamily)
MLGEVPLLHHAAFMSHVDREPPPAVEARAPALTCEAVYRQHAQTVWRWCNRLVGSGPDADDLTQEVFMVVNQQLASFRGDAKLTTWLFGITVRRAAHHHRSRGVARGRLRRLTPAIEQRLSSPEPTPLEQIEQRERRDQVHDALDRLKPPYRQALTMFELEARSTGEIAELLDRRVGSVWVLLHRARTALGAQMTSLERREDVTADAVSGRA